MFNLSFGEILIIGTVGILVIGPTRLPETARFIGHFIGRIQRQVTSVKADIKREMALEDMKSIHRQYEDAAQDMQNSILKTGEKLQHEVETASDVAPSPADKDAEKPALAGAADGVAPAAAGEDKPA